MDFQKDSDHAIQQDGGFDRVGSIETNVADGFTMAAVKDLLLARPGTKGQYPGLADVLKIFYDADVTFGNLDTNILDARSQGCPQAEYGGAYASALPSSDLT
ncbi:hypothetical protein [Mesorhizobium sp. M0018]|uniref:hypothetical protein n=1 Tax=Mesorhizobium sp. M0018 TaxID=2956844 RepID=UPI003338005F